MIMKLYGCFILLILLLNTRASAYVEEASNDRAVYKRRIDVKARGHDDEFDDDTGIALSLPTTTPKVTVNDPTRIAVFNSGTYDATIIFNYILNDLQVEQVLQTDIVRMQERSLFIPRLATNIRIRVNQASAFAKDKVIDWQVYSLKNTDEICYLLAGTNSNPVFGYCGYDYYKMLDAWVN